MPPLRTLALLALSALAPGCWSDLPPCPTLAEAGCTCPGSGLDAGSVVDLAAADATAAADADLAQDAAPLDSTSDGDGSAPGADAAGDADAAASSADASTTTGDAAACTPSCQGLSCGPNGCGGSCGSCGPGEHCLPSQTACAASDEAYDDASEDVHQLAPVLALEGHYGVALTGNHLLASDAAGGSALPRETPVSSGGTVQIPPGAVVRHALLWVTGVIFMKPGDYGAGDYTDDLGGALDTEADVADNGVTLSIDGAAHGPFDTATRLAPNPSSVGSEPQVSPTIYDPQFGTLTGVEQTVWGNRLDLTGLFAGASGVVEVVVDPPERLDVNGNDMLSNGGNPAGNTSYNLCSGAASWSLLVIYEQPELPRRNLVLLDGAWARAWDYLFFHNGSWQRPVVRIEHAPLRPGARFYIYAASGTEAGSALVAYPTCSCGCGGQYTLLSTSGPYGRSAYFSDQHQDPAACLDDPLHRDRSNGPWYLHSGGTAQPISGNDWTLFQSGALFTEFPNLYEGHLAPGADAVQPATDENDANAGHDTYGGHPWEGRGAVTYHAAGNAVSVVEVQPDASALSLGETTSYLFFKGDQKDVFKPQQAISVKYVLFETPL